MSNSNKRLGFSGLLVHKLFLIAFRLRGAEVVILSETIQPK